MLLFQNANSYGRDIAEALIKLYERGYGNFHVVGFSLGGVVAGIVGRSVKSLSRGRFEIPRITGIDPGQLPPFSSLTELSSRDAKFVDTIHGESTFFGSSKALGHANFYLNNGQRFPECASKGFLLGAACSHIQTSMVFAESVRNRNPRKFLASKCDNYRNYKNNQCFRNAVSPVGVYADESARGNYYLDISLKL
jgi:Lipase